MTESQNAKDTTGLNLSQLVRELTDVGGTDGDVENFDHVSYIIKQIFDNAKESQFNDALATYISRKNTEIEKVCSLHYQVFLFFGAITNDQGICSVDWPIAQGSRRHFKLAWENHWFERSSTGNWE